MPLELAILYIRYNRRQEIIKTLAIQTDKDGEKRINKLLGEYNRTIDDVLFELNMKNKQAYRQWDEDMKDPVKKTQYIKRLEKALGAGT